MGHGGGADERDLPKKLDLSYILSVKIVVATGIYPPEIGGPAQYAFNLEQEFKKLGHEIRVLKFSEVRHLPTFIRHLVYFFKIFSALHGADWCLTLDTFSVALPAVMAGKILGKKVIIRTGGDFLWENYVERTGDLVLLRNFYQTSWSKWNFKEKTVFLVTKWVLHHASLVVFSTDWQRQIWREPYQLNLEKTAIVENYYGPKSSEVYVAGKNFLVAGRNLKLKNLDILKNLKFDFEIGRWSPEQLDEKLKNCYALVVPSISDISPNIVLQAIRYNKPFILTKENGIRDRLGEIGVYVDPLNPEDIREKLEWLSEKTNDKSQVQKIKDFAFQHSWSNMAQEFLTLT